MSEPASYNPFPGDSYDTPENIKASWVDWLFLKTRLSFYLRNFYVFYRTGTDAKHGKLTAEKQTEYSHQNIKIAESCGAKIHLRGLNNLSAVDGPAVIIMNHMSLFETAVLHAFMRPRRNFCFVIKNELFKVPAFGNIMRSIECIGVGRANPRDDFKAVIEEGQERLKRGISVAIFPQSTRSSIFNPAKFNTIGVKLARAAGVPVIPGALKTDFTKNGKLIKDLGPVDRKSPVWFKFGEPIMQIKGSGKEEHQQIVDFIVSNLKEWGCEVMERSSAE